MTMYDPLHSGLEEYDNRFPCNLEPRKFRPRQKVKVRNYKAPLSLPHNTTALGVVIGFENGRNLGRYSPSSKGWIYHVQLEDREDIILVDEEELEAA